MTRKQLTIDSRIFSLSWLGPTKNSIRMNMTIRLLRRNFISSLQKRHLWFSTTQFYFQKIRYIYMIESFTNSGKMKRSKIIYIQHLWYQKWPINQIFFALNSRRLVMQSCMNEKSMTSFSFLAILVPCMTHLESSPKFCFSEFYG